MPCNVFHIARSFHNLQPCHSLSTQLLKTMSSPHLAGSQQKNLMGILYLFLRRHHQSPEINPLIEEKIKSSKFTCTSSCHGFIEQGCSCQLHLTVVLFSSYLSPTSFPVRALCYIIVQFCTATVQSNTSQHMFSIDHSFCTANAYQVILWTGSFYLTCTNCLVRLGTATFVYKSSLLQVLHHLEGSSLVNILKWELYTIQIFYRKDNFEIKFHMSSCHFGLLLIQQGAVDDHDVFCLLTPQTAF